MKAFSPLVSPPDTLMVAQALTVSGGATPSATSAVVDASRLTRLHVFCKNLGASTNVTITVYGSPDSAKSISATLAVFTLNATTTTQAGRYIEYFPPYVYAVATNADAANATTVNVTLSKTR